MRGEESDNPNLDVMRDDPPVSVAEAVAVLDAKLDRLLAEVQALRDEVRGGGR